MFNYSLKTGIAEKVFFLNLQQMFVCRAEEDLLFPCSESLRKNAKQTSEEQQRNELRHVEHIWYCEIYTLHHYHEGNQNQPARRTWIRACKGEAWRTGCAK